MQARIALGALTIAAIAGGIAWWLMSSPSATTGPQATPPPAQAQGEAPPNATLPTAPSTTTAATLPPPPDPPAIATVPASPAPAAVDAEAPLRDTIADLDRRARGGEAAAACRLGAELLRCERARALQPYTDNVEGQARAMAQQNAPQADIDRQIDAALQRQAENAAVLAHCEGVDERRWPVPARYFHLAAQAGHRPSMRQFLNAERFRADQLFRDPELIPIFRANAPRYFQQLLEEGDPDLLQRWTMGFALPYDILRDVLPPPYNDAGFAAAMQQQMLLARDIAPPTGPQRDPPTPEQIAEAERLYSRHFAARRPSDAELHRRYARSPYDLEAYGCDEAAGAAP